MYFRMALGNVKRSIRDYLIYFLTLTFSVCIFYSFNAIDAQSVMFELSSSKANTMELLMNIISGVSVFVSFILGGLIIYANNFLIKKRKKELGIYMTLGMGKARISKILFIETFCIGLLALVTGLVGGVFVSQGLSIFTAQLFEANMTSYQFVISSSSIFKTILYFGIIFVIVMYFNAWSISKYELIELIGAEKKSEELPHTKPFILVTLFILSMVCIGTAYFLMLKVGLDIKNIDFYTAIGLGILGTFLFFYSSLGSALVWMIKRPNWYLKGLNSFVLRQISYKVKTHFVSMSMICLMLLLTIGMLSSGLGFKYVLEKGLKESTPYDVTAIQFVDEGQEYSDVTLEDQFNKLGFNFENNEDYVFYNVYEVGSSLRDLLKDHTTPEEEKRVERLWEGSAILAIKQSDYNQLEALKGQELVAFNENEVLVLSSNTQFQGTIQNLIDAGQIEIAGKDYTIKNKKAINEQFENMGFSINLLTLIVPDQAVEGMPVTSLNMSLNYAKGQEEVSEQKLSTFFSAFKNGDVDLSDNGFVIGYIRSEIYESNKGLTTCVLFIGIYMGLIFLLASAALLALQQLVEAGDSKERYEVLGKIGASEKMIYKSVFVQVLLYFMLPLGLALIHSVVGIYVVNTFLVNLGQPNMGMNALMTVAVLILIYGGYFLATYSCYKSVIKQKR